MQKFTLFIYDVSDDTLFRMNKMKNYHEFYKITAPNWDGCSYVQNQMDKKQTVCPYDDLDSTACTGSDCTRVGVSPYSYKLIFIFFMNSQMVQSFVRVQYIRVQIFQVVVNTIFLSAIRRTTTRTIEGKRLHGHFHTCLQWWLWLSLQRRSWV